MKNFDWNAFGIDKKMGMQPVKGVEKAKKDADAKKETNKLIEIYTHLKYAGIY